MGLAASPSLPVSCQTLFTSTGPIVIRDFVVSPGLADPYPSTIEVFGMPTVFQSIAVTLTGLSHTYPDDIDILLVGPGGQTVVLMSDAGGSAEAASISLTFTDSAADPITDLGTLSGGSYRPINYEGPDAFGAPAPSGPYGTTLSAFASTDPNGTWRLFISDDTRADSGSLQSWTLGFTAIPEPASVAMAVAMSLAPLALFRACRRRIR